MRLRLIHILDLFEAKVFRHRFSYLCDLLAKSSWWGHHDCGKSGCFTKRKPTIYM